MVAPESLEFNADCHLFKTGIKPMWEDAANARGGKWLFVDTKDMPDVRGG